MSLSQEIKDFVSSYNTTYYNMSRNNHAGQTKPETEADRARAAFNKGYNNAPISGGIPAGDVTSGGNSETTSASTDGFGDNHALLMDKFIKRGVSPEVAMGPVLSLMGEGGRGLDPNAYNPDDNGKGPSGGYAQWNGDRLTGPQGLYNFAGVNDIKKIPFSKQADFMDYELDNNPRFRGLIDELKKGKTRDDGLRIWTEKYEVPADIPGQIELRKKRGPAFAEWWQSRQKPTAPLPTFAQAGNALPTPGAARGGLIEGYAYGGTVRPSGANSRPDRIAQAIPGVDDAGGMKGTAPGGATTARIATSPGYAEGGVAIPDPNQPMQLQQPQQQEEPSNPFSGLADAINSGVDYLSKTFNLHELANSAIPSAQAHEGSKQFAGDTHAMSQADYDAVTNTIDPNGRMAEGLRTAAGLQALYDYHTQNGNYDAASKTAGSMLLHLRGMAARYGSQAVEDIRKGDLNAAGQNMSKAYNMTPNTNTMSSSANRDGTVDLTEHGPDGAVMNRARVTPQQLLAAATGMKDGTKYWEILSQAAGAHDPEAVNWRQQLAERRQAETENLHQRNFERQARIDEAKSPSAEQNQAFQNWVVNGGDAEPPINTLHPSQYSPAMELYRTRVHGAGGAGAGAIPPNERVHISEAMDGAFQPFQDSLPEAARVSDAELPAFKGAAGALFSTAQLSPDRAFRAVYDLSDPTHANLDNAQPDKHGRLVVRLSDGSNLPLAEDAFNTIMALRKQRIQADSVQAAKNSQQREKVSRIDRGIGDALSAISPDWLKGKVQDYQNSVGR